LTSLVSHIIRRNILARVEQASPVVEEEQASLMVVKEEKTSLVVVEEEQASSVWEEEQSLPPLDHEADSSPSYFGWSSSNEKCERNLEDDEGALTATMEDDSSKLE
jgi:hypothetical protein